MNDKISYELLHLNRQLCFALYAATRAIIKAYGRKLGPLGLTYPQYLVMIVLWEDDGLTLTEIGERLLLDSGTLTPVVRRLEAANFVRKLSRSREDGREVEIRVTARGRRLQQGAMGARDHIVCRLKATEQDIARLRTDIMQVIDTLSAEIEPEADHQAARRKRAG